ncbi:hypothetical protein T492DRAFT_1040878, partial [Pavlovales sp. CCMP2436]
MRRLAALIFRFFNKFPPDLIALSDCQENQLNLLVQLLKENSAMVDFEVSELCAGPGEDCSAEPTQRGMAIMFNPAKLTLRSQETVPIGDGHTLRCRFQTLEDGLELDAFVHYKSATPPQTHTHTQFRSPPAHIHAQFRSPPAKHGGAARFAALVEYLRNAPPGARYIVMGSFSQPSSGYIQHGIVDIGFQTAFHGTRALATYAPPKEKVGPVCWDLCFVSRALTVAASKILTPIPILRTANGKHDGVAMRDALLLAAGTDHAPIGVELRLAPTAAAPVEADEVKTKFGGGGRGRSAGSWSVVTRR